MTRKLWLIWIGTLTAWTPVYLAWPSVITAVGFWLFLYVVCGLFAPEPKENIR